MTLAFGGSDAAGAWIWKDAYEAAEAAQVLFLQKFGPAMAAQAADAPVLLAMIQRIAALAPSETRRSEESQALQQFSTPLPLALVAARAAGLGPGDLVLEPSAGTGLLAVCAEIAGARLHLNEIAETRAGLLAHLFGGDRVTRHNGEQIHDYLEPAIRPTAVLINPPFSVSPAVAGRFRGATHAHLASALARLAPGGRLVAITGAGFSPHAPAWREVFVTLQARARVVFTAPNAGRVYARHGTSMETRLTVIDGTPADVADRFPENRGPADSAEALLDLVEAHLPPRLNPPAAEAAVPRSYPRPSIPRSQPTPADWTPRPASSPPLLASTPPARPNWATGTATARPPARTSPKRFTSLMRSSPSRSPAPGRTRARWSSRRPWPRWRRPSRATARNSFPAWSRTARFPTRSSNR